MEDATSVHKSKRGFVAFIFSATCAALLLSFLLGWWYLGNNDSEYSSGERELAMVFVVAAWLSMALVVPAALALSISVIINRREQPLLSRWHRFSLLLLASTASMIGYLLLSN